MRKIRFAVVQKNFVVGGIEENLNKIFSSIEEVTKFKADLIIFPELAITGYPPEDLLFRHLFIQKNLEALNELVKFTSGRDELIITGFVDMKDDIYNAAAVIQNGSLIGFYHKIMIQTRASDLRAAIVYANTIGGQDELVFDGHSFVVDENGTTIARAKDFEEEILFADIDIPNIVSMNLHDPRRRERIERGTEVDLIHTELKSKERKEISNVISPALTIEEEIFKALTLGTRDYVIKNGFKKVLIGLSGGIDSSLVAVIATEAIGKENVVGVMMPSMYSSKTTGNKSEMSTGYSTLYGDMAGGFAPIKDLYKTMVYRVCRWYNSKAGKEIIPSNILVKPPSAELKPNQVDQDTLPPYDVLDKILEMYVERDLSLEEITEMGFDAETVKKTIRLVDLSEYKRRQSPPGVKITFRAFGRDRRLPITNHFRR